MPERHLLIIEDDPGLRQQMRWCFEGITVHQAETREQGLALLAEYPVGVVTLDLGLPPDPGGTSEGEHALKQIQADFPHVKVVVITGREEKAHALNAIGHGAYDFYQKPIESSTLQFAVERAFNLAELELEYRALADQSNDSQMPLPGMIATDPAMLALCRQVERVANSNITVLIRGETGTGKEVIAQNIHDKSPRIDGPLITINCAAIPENLLESELFGHEKGSFTGAHARRIGKVEAADGGTLFLDEIGDMPLPLQAKILRFLQERRFERVGGTASIEVDVRVVSATHRNLQDMVGSGTFREDLYYRLSEIELALPPLRDRGTDAILIAEHILRKNAGGRTLRFTQHALDAIEAAPLSGNVRELENRVRRAAILCDGDTIEAADLQLQTESAPPDADDTPILPLKEVRAAAEQNAVVRALSHTGQNISETARLLGVSRPTLYTLIDKYNLSHDKENGS